MGPNAALVQDPPADPAAWSLALRALDLPGVIEVVPAARTVLLRCESSVALDAAITRLGDVSCDSNELAGRATVTVAVRYDGADLADVASSIGLTVDDVVELHAEAAYEVAFCGFAPGFAYLRGLPDELRLPRRTTPRTRVPAGSVAIASEYTAVYPTASPGGWHLLGSTDAVMFDPDRDPPALLQPGTTVRFVPR